MRHFYLLIFLALTYYVRSQTPDLIGYQGVARDGSGVPLVNRNISIRFELRQLSPSGTTVFSEQHTASTNNLGLFSLQIGKNNPTALAQVNWNSGPYFLAVAVDTAGGSSFVEVGVQELVSVPFAHHAREAEKVSSSYTNNVLTIGGNSYTLSSGTSYVAGAGISLNGSVIVNSAPDQTVTLQTTGQNIQVSGTYPDFIISSSVTLSHDPQSGELSVSDGNTVNIAPTLSIQNNVLRAGPATNTIVLPSVQQTTFTAAGMASVSPSSGSLILIDVPAPHVIVTNTSGPAAGSSNNNTININIPAPQYDQATGIFGTGSATADITPALQITGSTLTVGPPSNTILLPATAATTLNATGAATLNSNGPLYNLHVLPSTIAVTQTAGPAFAGTTSVNNWNINIPAPQYDAATGIFGTGTATTNITPSLSLLNGTLTVGPPSNTLALPAASDLTLHTQGIASVTPLTGKDFTVEVAPPVFHKDGPAEILGTYPNYTLSSPTITSGGIVNVTTGPTVVVSVPHPTFTSQGLASVLGTYPNYTVVTGAIPAPTVTQQGWAVVTPSTGTNFTVSVPSLSYSGTTGILSSGANSVSVVPSVSFTGNVLRVGPSSNSVSLAGISPWVQAANVVTLASSTATGVAIGPVAPGVVAGSGRYLTVSSTSSFAGNQSVAFELQGSSATNTSPFALINFLHANSSGSASNIARISAYHDVLATEGALGFSTHSGSSLLERMLIDKHGRVGINTTSPTATLHVNGTFRLADGNQGAGKVLTSDAQGNATRQTNVIPWSVTGNSLTVPTTHFIGTTDGMPFIIRTNNIERARFQANGYMGINTNSPIGFLHIENPYGSFIFRDWSPGGASILLTELRGDTALGPQQRFDMEGSTDFMDIGLNGNGEFVLESNDDPKILVQKDGNVGISTIAPTATLHVNGTFRLVDGTQAGGRVLTSDALGNASWQQNPAWTFTGNSISASDFLGSTNARPLNFRTNNVTRMTIETNGFVGINSTSPIVALDIIGSESQTVLNSFTASPSTAIRLFNSDQTNNNFASLIFGTHASNGSMYEGAKIAAVHVDHTTGSIHTDLSFMTRRPSNLVEAMRITSNGNVGINTSNPTATLQVNGTVRIFDGTQGAGKVLTSDANGNASWQNALPPGMIMAYAGSLIPVGWAVCDGSSLSRTAYPELFAVLGTSWGAASGSTFNLPDLRGMFLRGVDGGSGRDPDRNSRTAMATGGNTGDKVGTFQDDEFQSHNHQLNNFGQTVNGALLGTAMYSPGGVSNTTNTGGAGNQAQERLRVLHY